MTAFQEVLYTVALFGLFFIVIPVGVFTADLLKNYIGVPVVAVNAPFFELMQLMEALTSGYNDLVARATQDQQRIERLRKLAEARFPASQNNTYNEGD